MLYGLGSSTQAGGVSPAPDLPPKAPGTDQTRQPTPPPLTPSSSHGPHGCLPAMEAGAWRLQREAEQDGAK